MFFACSGTLRQWNIASPWSRFRVLGYRLMKSHEPRDFCHFFLVKIQTLRNPTSDGEHLQKWSAYNVCVLKPIMSFMAASRRSTITVPHRIGNSWVPCMSPNWLSKPNGCDPRVCPSEIRIWGDFGSRCKVGCTSQSIPMNLLFFSRILDDSWILSRKW